MKELYVMQIYIEIYGEVVIVLYGNKQKAKIYCGEEKASEVVIGWCKVDYDNNEMVYFGEKLSEDIIVHELTHAALAICDRRGIFVSTKHGEQEPFAYLMEFLCDKVLKAKKKDWYIWKGASKFENKFEKQVESKKKKRKKLMTKSLTKVEIIPKKKK
jgi:hypothetical protein